MSSLLDRIDAAGWSPRTRRLADVLGAVAVVLMAVWVWPRSAPAPGVELGAVPWWGGARDLLLEGPDAGEWARNIRLLAAWDLDALDHHRLPSWMLIVAAVHKLVPNVVIAGHLVNRALYLVMALSVYGLGRASGSRAAGLLAAAISLALPAAVLGSQRFGIDIAIMALIPAVMLVAAWATERWPVGLLAGLFAGFAAGLHYTTIPYVLPPLVLLILRGRGWKPRVGAVLLYVVGAALALRFLLVIYPVPTVDQLMGDIANGIDPGYRGQGRIADVDGARERLLQGLDSGVGEAVQAAVDGTRIGGVPWGLLVILPWLGIAGLGLRRAVDAVGDHPVWSWLRRSDPGLGIGLLLCLAPLPFLAAVDAPERYSSNFYPVVAVLSARGLLSIVSLLDHGIRRLWAAWPRGPVGLVLVLPLCGLALGPAREKRILPPPRGDELGLALLADALTEHLPPGTGVASPIREALVIADMEYCPLRICPVVASESAYTQCLKVMAQECAGDGPIPYVRTTALHFYDPNATARQDMDAWVAEHYPAAAEVRHGEFAAWLHLIERPELPENLDPLRDSPAPPPSSGGSTKPVLGGG